METVHTYTVSELYEAHNMKINEIISEGKTRAKLTKRQQQSMPGANTYHDAVRANSDYVAYRMGMAVAGTDGKTPPNIDKESWIGKEKSAHPYTKEEQDMLKLAYKAAGASYTDLNKGDMRSLELDSVNKASPTPKKKTNKYGV